MTKARSSTDTFNGTLLDQPPNLREFSVKTTVEKNTLDNKQLNHVKRILSFSEGVLESIEVVWEQIRVELQFQ